MKKKRRRIQVTCWCSVYTFPHRIGGGRCQGILWAQSYREVDGKCCKHCNNDYAENCDVADGRENIAYCQAIQEFLLHPPSLRLPIAIDILIEEKYEMWYQEEEL